MDPRPEQLIQQEVDAQSVRTTYTPRKVFLLDSSAGRIDTIRQSLVSTAYVYQLLFAPRSGKLEWWIKIHERVNDEIPPTVAVREAELRTLMSDVEEPQT